MPFYSALTTLPSREAAEALAESLEGFDPEPTGVGCFEIEDGSGRYEVGAYFEEEPDDIVLALMAAIYGAAPFAVSQVPETDWVAHVRRELQPVEAGRFFVYGSHDADKVPDGSVALLIEAAMAFGTGHHGTTKGCLLALDRIDRAGVRARNVADIGCGTAVLAMAAAAIWDCATIASDIDPVAVEVARSNVAANGQAARVQVVEAAGFDQGDLRSRAPYDLIFANILKGPLLALAPDLAANLASGGRAVLSGILASQASELVEKYMSFGLALTHREDIGEWVTLELVKS
ncbi:MAG: 50S ribosomal protein L11 methyltransferase [Paracoccaceae bacterium]